MFKRCFCIVFCLVVALNATAYAQDNPPVVTSTNPTSGLEWGGTRVNLRGSNFQSGATVTFGDREATDIRWRASIAIDAVTPAHPAGNVDVIVTNPDGQAGILENGFTFLASLFAPPTHYAVGPTPGVARFSADLDGDGDIDLAAANWNSRNVSVMLNHGDGTFGPKVDYATNDATCVLSADLDGDGDNDLAVANLHGNIVSVFLNHGDGTFAPRVDYVTGRTTTWGGLFVVDLDGDGDNDLAVTNFDSHTVSILLNHGDGTFAPKVDYDAGRFPRSMFSADLDGDGDNDLAVANDNISKVSILLNHGDGTFAPKVVYDVGTDPAQIFIADLDGDGDNDLVVAYNVGNAVSVFLNHRDGTFEGKVDYVTGYNGPRSLSIADLDGDGDNDLVVGYEPGNAKGVSVLLNLSDIPTAVTEYEELSSDVPETYFLSQNFPNPFNLSTTIRFELPEAGVVDLSVYNIYGQRIRKLLSGEQRAGHHSVLWDGKDGAGREVASGIYLYRLEAGGFIQTRKAVLLR